VSENRGDKIILGPKWKEVTGGWRKLNNEGIHKSQAKINIIIVVKLESGLDM
jgi:hypothetical protein